MQIDPAVQSLIDDARRFHISPRRFLLRAKIGQTTWWRWRKGGTPERHALAAARSALDVEIAALIEAIKSREGLRT